jgi:hypothetical protein
MKERPQDMPRMAIKKFILPIGVTVKNGGTVIDGAFASHQKRIGSSS